MTTWTTFRYKKEKSDLGIVWRPIADIIIETKSSSTELPVYIDSGADISMIPLQYGLALGFKRPTGKIRKIRGVSGRVVPYVIKRIKVSLGSFKLSIRVAWALIDDVPPLLGRMDIFNKFRVVFDERKRIVEFHRI